MLFQSLVYRAAIEICCKKETEIVTPPIASQLSGTPTTERNHFTFVRSDESPIALLAVTSSLFFNSSLGPNVISNTVQKSDKLLNFFLVLDTSSASSWSTTLQFSPRLILQQIYFPPVVEVGNDFFSRLFWSSRNFRRSLREIVVYCPTCSFLQLILFAPKKHSSSALLLASLPPPALERIILYDCSSYEIGVTNPSEVPSIYFPNLSEIHLRTSTKDCVAWDESLQTYRLQFFECTFAFNTSQFVYDYLGCFRTTPLIAEANHNDFTLSKNNSSSIRLFMDGGIRDMFFADDDETAFHNKLKSQIFKRGNMHFHHLNIDLLFTHNHFRRQEMDWLMTESGLAIMRNLSVLVLNARCHSPQQEIGKRDERSIMFDDKSSRCSFYPFGENFNSLLRFGAFQNPASPLKILDFSNFSEVFDSMLTLSPNDVADGEVLTRAETQGLIESSSCFRVETPSSEKYFFFPNLKALDVSGNQSLDGSFLVNWAGLKNPPSVSAPLSNLEILNMSQSNLDPKAVGDVFTKFPKMKILKLVRLHKAEEDVQFFNIDTIFQSLSSGFWAKSLVEVDLRLTPIGDQGLQWLVDACKINNNNNNNDESYSTSSLRILRIENFDRSAVEKNFKNEDQSPSQWSFRKKMVSILGLQTICELKSSLEILEIGVDFEMIFDRDDDCVDPFTKAKNYFNKHLANLRELILL